MKLLPCICLCAALASLSLPLRAAEPAAEARLTLGRREAVHTSNRHGDFPTQLIAPGSRVPVRLKLPPSATDAPVVVGVMDGGRILMAKEAREGGGLLPIQRGQRLAPDAQGQVQFVFEAAAGAGVYRVFAHRGGKGYTLEFWVGDKLPTDRTK